MVDLIDRHVMKPREQLYFLKKNFPKIFPNIRFAIQRNICVRVEYYEHYNFLEFVKYNIKTTDTSVKLDYNLFKCAVFSLNRSICAQTYFQTIQKVSLENAGTESQLCRCQKLYVMKNFSFEKVKAFIYKIYLYSQQKNCNIWIEWNDFRKTSLIIHQKRRTRRNTIFGFEIQFSPDFSLILRDISIPTNLSCRPYSLNLSLQCGTLKVK